jgi:predicted nucleic acid-binding protein
MKRYLPPHGTGLIGDIDTLIAALERELTIVTADTDFEKVMNYRLWMLPISLV